MQPHAIEPDLRLAERLFDRLRAASLDPPGVTRDAYGPGEEGAHALCIEAARGVGLEVTRDLAGNSYVTLPGRDRSCRPLLTGSHLDSVRHGGNDDGAAGVVAGLAALAGLRAAARARGIEVHEMPSGGGHDALAFHDAGVPTAMLFIRNRNGSHNPDEAMELADFAEAARILTAPAATHEG